MPRADMLVIGGPQTGKTHYGGQLYGRLRDRPGRLALADKPGDTTPFEEVLRALGDGRSAGHTPTATWVDLDLNVKTEGGEAANLFWPDYGGEQVQSLVDQREVPARWRSRLAEARAWMLFIRPNALQRFEDALHRPAKAEVHPRGESRRAWDENARVVETLQVLLHVSGRTLLRPLGTPRLAVMLSCWDELDLTPTRTPEEVLAERLPMVSAFIESNWAPGAATVWGLSSLGRALSPKDVDEDFLFQGTSQLGWVIRPGTIAADEDLTAPVAWLLGGA